MKKSLKGISYAKYGYIFSLPFIVIYLLFSLYPTLYTIALGFTNRQGVVQKGEVKVLSNIFENYQKVLGNETFKQAIKNTIIMWVINFIPQIVLALILTAWFTSRSTEIKGKGFFKVVFYMPNIMTAATVALLFTTLFGYPMGPVNDFLTRFGFIDAAYQFAAKPWAARIMIAFIQFLMWYGNTMIVLTAGVLGISPDIFEAAEIDGANGVQMFFRITLPNIRTILVYTLITSLIGGLNMFDIPYSMWKGEPANSTSTANTFIYSQGFTNPYRYNVASAASMIMFVLILIGSIAVFFIMRDKDEVQERKIKKTAKGGLL